jgi:hypothetical protein
MKIGQQNWAKMNNLDPEGRVGIHKEHHQP